MRTSAERLCRLAQAAGDQEDPLSALEVLVELRRELDVVTREQVASGLAGGRSFADVARVLGISRQAAHRRFRQLAPGRRVAATEQARQVLGLAREEAALTQAATIGSDHMLIAVLRSGGDAARTLVGEGATLEKARAVAADSAPPPGSGAAQHELRSVLRKAARDAIARGERCVDVDGLLFAALAEPESRARIMLAALGVDPGAVRQRLGSNRTGAAATGTASVPSGFRGGVPQRVAG